MSDTVYIGVSPMAGLDANMKFRLVFRDAWTVTQRLFVWGGAAPLETRAQKFFDTLGGSTIARPVSQPLVGASGTVFVIDVRTKTDVPDIPVRTGLESLLSLIVGCELIRATLVPASEGSQAAETGRQNEFLIGAQIDEKLDSESGVTGAVNTVKKKAQDIGDAAKVAGIIVLVVAVAVLVVYLRPRN